MARSKVENESNDDHHQHQGESSNSNQMQIPVINSETRNILRNLIFQQLDEIRTGNAYVEHELATDCFSKLLMDDEIYTKFVTMTAKKWMEIDLVAHHESGLNGGKLNKKRKLYTIAIRGEESFVKSAIKRYTLSHESPTAAASSGTVGEGSHHDDNHNVSDDMDTVSSLSESKVSSSSRKRKKKSKKSKKKNKKDKKKSKKSKKRKRDHHSANSNTSASSGDDEEEEDGEDRSREDEDINYDNNNGGGGLKSKKSSGHHEKDNFKRRKAQFEKEKQEYLSGLPSKVKKQFRQLGFGKWNKKWLPVMFLGPYDVAPGAVREQWMSMKEKSEQNMTTMSRLVFWYGTSEADMDAAFSFLAQTSTLTFEEGCKKDYNVASKAIQKKINKGQKLSKSDNSHLEGLKQLKEDVILPTNQRLPWLFDFEEEYEVDYDEDEDMEDKQEDEKPAKKKKKKKNQTFSDEEEEKEKEYIKVSKKKTKRKRLSDEKSQSSKKKKKMKKSKDLDDEIMQEVEMEEAVLNEDAPSDDDKGDDDFSVDNESDSENDDEEDGLYEEKAKDKVSAREKQVRPAKSKEIKVTKASKKTKKLTLREKKEQEQFNFETCEKFFLPIMSKLEKQLKQSNISHVKTERYLQNILDNVEILTPSFIEHYQIGLLIKKLRSRLKQIGNFNQLCKSITGSMRQVYTTKKAGRPQNFVPKPTMPLPLKDKKVNDMYIKSETPKTIKLDDDQSSTVSGTSHKRVKSVTECNDNLISGSPMVQKIKSSNKKKSFSLMNIMSQANQSSSNLTKVNLKKDSLQMKSESSQHETVMQQPQWTVVYDGISQKKESQNNNIDRELAMDFLNSAVANLPKEKIHPHSVACALEDAIFHKFDKAAENYWDRVHAVCAALAGKKKMGHLGEKIIDGDCATPLDVINISKKLFAQSFEGATG